MGNMTWQEMQDRLRKVIQIFQENIHRFGTGEDVIKFSKDMFLTTSQAFNIYATSVVMEENKEGPPGLILSMIERIERRLDELILNCPFEPEPVESVSKVGVSGMEGAVRSAEEFFNNMNRVITETQKMIGGVYET